MLELTCPQFNRPNKMSIIANQASEAAQIPKLMMYGGGAFSVGQWFAANANWIAAAVGIAVTVAGFVWNRVDAARKTARDKADSDFRAALQLEEHKANMALLAAELEKVRKG